MRRVTLRAGKYEAVFLPDLGMLGASIKHRGSELLSLHGGVAGYRSGHSTGLPLLAPWANRLSKRRFRAAGIEVDLRRVPLHVDGNGLPIHGTMTAVSGWEVVRLEPARLVARYGYSTPEMLRAFPFPHELTIDARVSERGLRVVTSVRPTGRRRVPVSFGFHPYFKAGRGAVLRMPASRHLELDRKGIPTGRTTPQRSQRAALKERVFDDLYALGRDRTFVLHRHERDVEVRFGVGYPFAQIFAPPGKPFVAIEPMTAPTNALVTSACPVVRPSERFSAAFTVSARPG